MNLRQIQSREGNVGVGVTLTSVLPNRRYDVHLFVDGQHYLNRALGSPITDPTGCVSLSAVVGLPPGERVLAFSITEHKSEADLYVSPNIYKNGGITMNVPLPGAGGLGRPRR